MKKIIRFIIFICLTSSVNAQTLISSLSGYVTATSGSMPPTLSQLFDGNSATPAMANNTYSCTGGGTCAGVAVYWTYNMAHGYFSSGSIIEFDLQRTAYISSIYLKGMKSSSYTKSASGCTSSSSYSTTTQYRIYNRASALSPWLTIKDTTIVISSAINVINSINKAARFWKIEIVSCPQRAVGGTNCSEYAVLNDLNISDIEFYEKPLIASSIASPFINGQCTTLTAAAAGETYLWSPGGETTQSITVCNSGTYTCQVTNTSFAGNQDHTASIAVSTLGSQDNWVGPNGEVYSIHRNGNTVVYGGDFDAVGPITGSSSPISESTAAPNTANARVYGTVNSTISDGAGGWYIGGTFSRVGNYTSVSNLAHINADGSVDTGFNPVPNGPVYTMTLSGNSLYIGGSFTTVKGLVNNYIAKIEKTTGTPLFWNANCNNTVRSMLLYADKIILGGDFTSIGGAARNYLGAVDTTFVQATTWTPNPNAAVHKVLVNGSKLYVGGDFTTISAVAKSRGAGYSLPGFTIDGYDFGANGRIHDFAFYNNVLYTAGTFTIIGGATRNYLAGLNYLNMIANSFNANADGIVRSIGILNTNLIVGGDFANIGGAARSRLASLVSSTGIANPWDPNVIGVKGTSYNVNATAFYGTTIFAGGTFWSVGATTRNNIAAVDATTGSLLAFNPNANGIVRTVFSDGTNVYFGGDFTMINSSVIKNRIAQVNATTGTATGWNPNADGSVNAIAISGTTLYAGGAFANIGGAARSKIAALNIATGGAIAFNPSANANVNALAISGDTLVIGGAFTTIGGQTRNRISLYNTTSSTLLASDPNANNTVNALAIKGNKLYVGGSFTTLAGTNRNSLAEYNLTSSIVTSFNSNIASSTGVNAISTSDSSVYLGGGFQYANSGQPINNAGTVKTLSNLLGYWMPQPDDIIRTIYIGTDKAYVGGRFKVIQSRYQPFFATTDLFNSGSAPTISSVSSLSGCVNNSITINGTGFSGITSVNIGTTSVPFTVLSNSVITITPNIAISGVITVSNNLGNVTGLQTVVINALPTVNAGIDQTVCAGTSITLSGTGANTYSWNNGVSNGIGFTPASTTTYTVTGTNTTTGCTNTDQVVVNVNALPTVNAGIDQTVCAGTSVTLSGSGANTYSWNNGVNNAVSFTPASTTTFTVTGTNTSTGCTNTDQTVVTVNNLPTVNAGIDQTVCAGTSITLSGSGANTYSWNNGVTNAVTFTPASTTTYTVTGTNTTTGCTNTDQVVVTVNTLPTVNAGIDQTVCAGTSVTLLGSGANSYSWNNGVTDAVAFTPASTASYTVTGTNTATGCTNTDQVVVTVNALPTVNAGIDQTVCSGTSITLSGTGANTYSWNNGVSNGIGFTPASTITYTVTGTNTSTGCTNTDQVVVTVNALPTVNAGIDQTVCAGTSISLSGSGANTYSWNNGVTNAVTFTPASTITYTVTGTNTTTGCTNTDQVVVTVNALPTVNAGIDQTLCSGTSITLSGTGANTYSWNNGVSNGIGFTPASTITYTVTGTNTSTGCTNTDQVVVTVNALPTVNAGIDQTVCAGTSVSLSGSGANTYSWNNGINNAVAFTPASTTTYTLTGTNTTTGCTNTDQAVVTVNALPTVNAGIDQAVCAGTSVTLSGSGANTYSWNNSVSNGIGFTPASTITYTVTGTNTTTGCTNTDQVVVTVNALPTVNAGIDQTVCSGTSVSLSGSGANTYSWNNGINNAVAFTPASTTTYTLTGTNTTTGCTNTDQAVVNVNALPTVNAGIDQTVCAGTSITLSGTGATTYSWNNGVSNAVAFTPASTITYTVTGTNTTTGCTNTDQVVVTVNALPTVNAGIDQTVCSGTSVSLSGSGANTYSWNNGINNAVAFTPASTTTYTLTGTNTTTGCTNTDQAVVNVNALPTVNAGIDQTVCAGTSITLSGTGANTYSWNNGVSNGIAFTPASTITYTVTGTNTTTGCTNTDQVVVTVNALPTVNAGIDQTLCAGTSVTLLGSGANSYSWNNGVTNAVAFTPASTATYTVTGTNTATGCTNTDQAVLTVNTLPTVNAGIDQTVCAGTSITLSGSGANTYSWNNSVINAVAFTPASTATYTVTGTNTTTGCTNTDQVVVTVNALPTVNAGIDQTVCAGTSVTLSGSGANTYSWNNGVNNAVSFTPASTATYTLTGTNTTTGCTNTDQAVVTVNALPTVNAGIDQTVCTGTSVTLSGSGATTYSWDNGVSNGIGFTPASTITYTVTGTNTSTGCTNTDQVVVTVNALPTVNAGIDQTVCAGTSVSLSGSGANTYSWNNGINNAVAFTPASTTTYTLTGTNTTTGCTNTDQVVVTVNALPTVNAGTDQTVCAGNSVTLSGSGANTYAWSNNVSNGVGFNPTVSNEYVVTGTDVNGCLGTDTVNVTVNNPSSSTLTETALDSYSLNGQNYTQSGTYTQVIPNATGCDSTITLNLSLDFTGINETQTGFTIAPNPTSDLITITSTDALNKEYMLFDPQGRKVLSGTLAGTTTQLDLSKLARGNYLLQIGEKKTPIKLVKE